MKRLADYACTVLIAAIFAAGFVTTSGAVAPPGGPQTRFTIPHVNAQILVKRAAGTPISVVEQLLAGLGGTPLEFSAAANLDVFAISNDTDLEAAIALLAADPRIEFAEPNYTSNLWARPNDLDFPQQWSKENTGVNAAAGLGHAGADMNMIAAWDRQKTAPGVIVAIIDDSLETTHIDLVGNVMATGRCFASPNSARPCVNGPNDPNPSNNNDFHGTLVAGAAAARGNNGIGIAGTAWETNLLPLKVDLSYFAIVKAIDEAIAQNADIINMSFGGPVESRSLSEALDRAQAAGILAIASAGNADANNAVASHYPSNLKQDNVLSIAATDSRDRVSGFSQWGSTTVSLAAPGDLIRTTANNNSYAFVSGTSFSAPHTAGVAALVQAATGATDYRQLKAHLMYGTSEGRDALSPVVPGQDKEAVPGRVATGRLDANLALAGPTGGVLVISDVSVNDAATGNGNGELDPGETARLEVTIRNIWNDEVDVSAVLSSRDSGKLLVNDVAPVTYGTVARDAEVTASFGVHLSNTVSGNEQLFMQLDLTSATSGALPSRYFYLEVATLTNGQTMTQRAQRYNWDEFHAFHIDVPAGASDLSVSTSGPGDVDLLLRYAQSPEYLITLNAMPGKGFYYVDSDSKVSATAGANESIQIASPLPGTYHAVVVNFDQQAKNYDITASYSIPTAGEIAFTQATYSAAEDGGDVTITVTRSGGVAGASVDFSTVAQTATAGSDYTEARGTLTWGLGENGSKSFTVRVHDDNEQEPTETVGLTLSNANGSTLGTLRNATLEITDNDSGRGTLAFEQASYSVTEGTAEISISVMRSGGTLGQVSVDYATQSGQAVADTDFADVAGTLTWADGESGAKTFSVSIIDDTRQEAPEAFSINLSNAQGATLGTPGLATVTINDNDVASASTNGGSGGGGGVGYLTLAVLLLISILMRSDNIIGVRVKFFSTLTPSS